LLTSPSLAKLSLKELSIHTTNENWVPGFFSRMDVRFNEISLCGLSITLNVNKPRKKSTQVTFSDWLQDEVPNRNKMRTHTATPKESNTVNNFNRQTPVLPRHRKSKYEIINNEELEFEYQKLRENDVYLLYPLDLTVRVKKILDQSRDFQTEPQRLLWIETKDPIIVMLNKDHMQFLGALNNHLKSMNIVHRNLHLRPNGSPKKMPREWLIYAVKAIIEDKKRAKDFSKDPSSFLKMKKYIDLYKRQQTIVLKKLY